MKGRAPAGVLDLCVLAWPSVLSFVCNGAYRVNDQYWVGGLGAEAQAALGASFFLLILNFALYFVAVAGALPLVARATGSDAPLEREHVVRHALVLGTAIALALMAARPWLTPVVVELLGLEGRTAAHGREYLATMYTWALPMALAPVVDNVFIAMGRTRVPLLLQVLAVSTNFVLNPCLIYGWGPFEAHGIAGAALATCASRALTVVLGLCILRYGYQVRFLRQWRIDLARIWRILRIGIPSSLSVAFYAGVYLALYQWVLSPLGRDVMAGLSIGFNAFEGVSFPFYLGIAVAGSSLVGRNLGAGDPAEAQRAVSSVRWVGTVLGLCFLILFLSLGPVVVPLFSDSPGVQDQALLYVRVLALSQVFVALEAMHEKTLMGAGHTLPIFVISVPGNALRVPLAYALAFPLGFGAAGVWWAINLTTLLKSVAFAWVVRRRTWLTRTL